VKFREYHEITLSEQQSTKRKANGQEEMPAKELKVIREKSELLRNRS
jgi:hypothetical protein